MDKIFWVKNIKLVLIVLTLSFSCSPKNVDNKQSDIVSDSLEDIRLAEKLVQSGYLKYVPDDKRDSLQQVVLSDFNIYDDRFFRFSHIDAEELCEYNFDFFMPKINEILAKRKFKLSVRKSSDYEKSNEIYINDISTKLYSQEDLEQQTFLDIGAMNFFKQVNEILKNNGIEEKFYLLYNGNDLSTFLITDTQFEIIKERFYNQAKQVPYLP
jgi:hypothetical protein